MAGKSEPTYEFETIGRQLVMVSMKSAEDQLTEAQNLMANTKVLTGEIEKQIKEHAALLDSMNTRLKTFGAEILDAHKKYANGEK